jgi:hypothetical protein
VKAAGPSISVGGTPPVFLHVTGRSNSAVQDLGSFALADFGLIVLGLSVSHRIE